MPEVYISLGLDSEEGVDERHPDFQQLAAAAWGLIRIGADQRDRFGRVADIGNRVTHSDFGGRAATGADVTPDSHVPYKRIRSALATIKGTGFIALEQQQASLLEWPPELISDQSKCQTIQEADLCLDHIQPWIGSLITVRDQLSLR